MVEDFNELEVAILEWFKFTYANAQLTEQIESAKFLRRDWTGVGFYIYIEIPRQLQPIHLDDFEGHWPIDGPNLASDDIQYGGSSILWGTDGYIDCIEMYAYGEFFNKTVNEFKLLS